MGTVHAENAQRLPGAELVAVAAAREWRAQEVGRALGVPSCGYAELFARDDVDGVVLAARSVDHGPLALEVLRSGKHLFLEKPGATSLADHDALRQESAARPGQVVQVGYMRRYDRAFLEAHRRVRAGDGGKPLVILLTSRDTEWPEGEDPHGTGGFLLDMASHDYDAACWLFDDEPVEVSVARQALVYPVLAGLGDLDNGLVTIRFARGGIAVTHVSRTSPFGHDIRCEVVGSEGSVFVRGPGDGTADLIDRSDAAGFPSDYRARFADAYTAELTAFVAACGGAGPAGPTLDDDRRAVATGIAARASAEAGQPLAVGTDWPWP
jgi:scyllo-inositol 2-dehydrogenase (NAD+)